MAEIVNLRRARKAAARRAQAAAADAARSLHGRTKIERDEAQRQQDRAARTLDQAKLSGE